MWWNVFLPYALDYTLNLKDTILPHEEFKMQPGGKKESLVTMPWELIHVQRVIRGESTILRLNSYRDREAS